MKTVGSILRQTREAKGLTPADVEKATKIREKYVRAIESDNFGALPSPSYAKGFIRNYAEYLEMSTETTMAFFRRQTTEAAKSSLLPKGVSEPLNAPFVHLTPGRFIALLVSILVVAFLIYLGNQYVQIGVSPPLTVTSPINQQIVTEGRVVVEGRTNADTTVMINGISTIVRDDGRFYEQVPLEPGVNKVIITAMSRFGKTTTVIREVGHQPD